MHLIEAFINPSKITEFELISKLCKSFFHKNGFVVDMHKQLMWRIIGRIPSFHCLVDLRRLFQIHFHWGMKMHWTGLLGLVLRFHFYLNLRFMKLRQGIILERMAIICNRTLFPSSPCLVGRIFCILLVSVSSRRCYTLRIISLYSL